MFEQNCWVYSLSNNSGLMILDYCYHLPGCVCQILDKTKLYVTADGNINKNTQKWRNPSNPYPPLHACWCFIGVYCRNTFPLEVNPLPFPESQNRISQSWFSCHSKSKSITTCIQTCHAFICWMLIKQHTKMTLSEYSNQ